MEVEYSFPIQALIGYVCIRLNPRVLKWIGVKLN
jgi:hypothetical protein